MTVYEQLLIVQENDTAADQLHHKRAALPARSEVAELEATIAAIDAQVAEIDTRLGELDRSQKRLEDEVSLVEEKISHENATLYSGNVKAAKELQALQDEIESLTRRQRSLEDDELDIMEAREPVDAMKSEQLERRGVAASRLAEVAEVLATEEAEVDGELAAVLAAREEAVSTIDDEALLREYQRSRTQLGGVAIAKLVGSTCGGCHLMLSAVELDKIRKLPSDARVTCEECGRLLVR